MLMGVPLMPFRLCDFVAVYEEATENGVLRVRGALPGGDMAVALFRRQSQPKGAWVAHSLEGVKQ